MPIRKTHPTQCSGILFPDSSLPDSVRKKALSQGSNECMYRGEVYNDSTGVDVGTVRRGGITYFQGMDNHFLARTINELEGVRVTGLNMADPTRGGKKR